MPKQKLSLEAINQRLRTSKVGVALLQRGDRLYLQATLPPKPNSNKPVRQISLGIYANEWGFAEAEASALKLGSDLARGQFDWGDWTQGIDPRPRETCADWVESYRLFLWSSKLKGTEDQKRTLWRKRYFNVGLKWLPPTATLNQQSIATAVLRYVPNTRSRQLACQVLQQFANWCGVECDAKQFSGGYSVKSVKREIPTDHEIETAIDTIKNPQWQRVAALMAVYGLRDHECWYVRFEWVDDPLLGRVLEARVKNGDGETTKTGERSILPLLPQWVERWGLGEVDAALPKITVRTNDEYGERTARQFKRYGVGFQPYSLRHAFAIRGTVRFKIPSSVMAAMMGHDPDVHLRTYNRHLSEEQKRLAYRSAIANQR